MNNRRFWIILGGIIILSVAFLFLNFHAAISNTHFEKNISTTGMGDGLPDAMQRRDKISIALVGESPLAGALKQALKSEMRSAGIGESELVKGLETRYPNPVLVVKVGKPGMFWTPFFATSQFSIQVGYASSGDTTIMGEKPATLDSRNGPILSMYGEYKVNDRSWGLISRLGYHQILADYLAQQIVAAVKDLYKVSS